MRLGVLGLVLLAGCQMRSQCGLPCWQASDCPGGLGPCGRPDCESQNVCLCGGQDGCPVDCPQLMAGEVVPASVYQCIVSTPCPQFAACGRCAHVGEQCVYPGASPSGAWAREYCLCDHVWHACGPRSCDPPAPFGIVLCEEPDGPDGGYACTDG